MIHSFIKSQILAILTLFISNSTLLFADESLLKGTHTCTSSENWNWNLKNPAEIPEAFKQAADEFIHGKLAPILLFSEAIAIRKEVKTQEAKIFMEYWISRVLFTSHLPHIAYQGFSQIISRKPGEEIFSVQLASLECLLKIHDQYPTLVPRIEIFDHFEKFKEWSKDDSDFNSILWRSVALFSETLIESDQEFSPSQKEKLFKLVQDSNEFKNYILSIFNLKEGKIASQELENTLKLHSNLSGDHYSFFQKRMDTLHLLLGREYYRQKEYLKAAEQFKQIRKSSNELSESLSELSWAYLLAFKYSEAIGTSINLQTGGLRHTFSPEGPMVMAISLNELCQFPESIRAIEFFRKKYDKSYLWLKDWKDGKVTPSLYQLAVQYLKKKGTTPERIASEWIRSPYFISFQNEINLLFDEKEATRKLGESGILEQSKLGKLVFDQILEIKPRFDEAEEKQTEAKVAKTELEKIRTQYWQYQNLRFAAPVWRNILTHYLDRLPSMERKISHSIENHLSKKSDLMLQKLDEISQNLELIEVEIYHGASEDIIWQNAHPDYKTVASQMNASESDDTGTPSNKTWNWGKIKELDSDEKGGEIWEDELGSFKANLFDNCLSKDRYLSLKLKNKKKERPTL